MTGATLALAVAAWYWRQARKRPAKPRNAPAPAADPSAPVPRLGDGKAARGEA